MTASSRRANENHRHQMMSYDTSVTARTSARETFRMIRRHAEECGLTASSCDVGNIYRWRGEGRPIEKREIGRQYIEEDSKLSFQIEQSKFDRI